RQVIGASLEPPPALDHSHIIRQLSGCQPPDLSQARPRHMADITHLYPPTPAAVPPDLTTPTSSYRNRVVIVLLCLIVFVGIYLLLTVGSAYACYACFSALGKDDPQPTQTYTQQRNTRSGQYYSYTPPPKKEEKPVFWLIVGGIGSAALFLF